MHILVNFHIEISSSIQEQKEKERKKEKKTDRGTEGDGDTEREKRNTAIQSALFKDEIEKNFFFSYTRQKKEGETDCDVEMAELICG